MVHVVLSSGGLNEKGHGKQFKWNPLIRSMIDDVCGDSSSTEEVSVIYCDDGSPGDWFDHNNPDCVELKCLRKLVEHLRPSAGLKMEKFSFTYPSRPAMNMIQNADIFYFKGYGGNTELDETHNFQIEDASCYHLLTSSGRVGGPQLSTSKKWSRPATTA